MEKLDVAIVDDNPLILGTLDELTDAEDGLSVVGEANSGAGAINMIVDTAPGIVLLDLVVPKIDGISTVEKIRNEHTFLEGPTLTILSAVSEEWTAEDAFKAGANYYLMEPSDKEILVNRIRHIGKLPDKQLAGKVLTAPFELGEGSRITRKEYMKGHLEVDIIKMLHELDVPVHIKGYQHLRDAIAISVKDQEMMNSVTKILYPAVAGHNQAAASRVERAIRHTIEVTRGRDRMKTIDEVFGYTISTGKGKPVDSGFIALISDKILLKYKEA